VIVHSMGARAGGSGGVTRSSDALAAGAIGGAPNQPFERPASAVACPGHTVAAPPLNGGVRRLSRDVEARAIVIAFARWILRLSGSLRALRAWTATA
jgi:hypothetical protein